MISHRAGPLPLEGGMETLAGNTYRLKRGRQRQRERLRESRETGGKREGGQVDNWRGEEERRQLEMGICRRNK